MYMYLFSKNKSNYSRTQKVTHVHNNMGMPVYFLMDATTIIDENAGAIEPHLERTSKKIDTLDNSIEVRSCNDKGVRMLVNVNK